LGFLKPHNTNNDKFFDHSNEGLKVLNTDGVEYHSVEHNSSVVYGIVLLTSCGQEICVKLSSAAENKIKSVIFTSSMGQRLLWEEPLVGARPVKP
jgi:hypothetical protein